MALVRWVARAGFGAGNVGVEAVVGKAEAFDGTAVEEVLGDDLVDVFERDAAVPDGFGVDDDGGAVLALVEAAGLVGADAVLETGVFAASLRAAFELFAVAGAATGAGAARRARWCRRRRGARILPIGDSLE